MVPPGKKAWPYHAHHVNEELFIILEGEGMLRIGGAEHPVKVGDVIARPAYPSPPGGDLAARRLRYISRAETSLDYWDGE